MGSDSDLEIMQEAAKILDELTIPNETLLLSTHRAPEETAKYAMEAKGRGIKVIIAGAGGAAALPGSIASLTTLPVIGVPVTTKSLEGIDSLLSIVQMPPGVPVATVGIGSAKNAGLLAAEIIGACDAKVNERVTSYKQKIKLEVLAKNKKLQSLGINKYLEEKAKK
ncbi:5-(carboxyamino)imidazole ribonucleotide mutase [Candidatus Woesebacteria bacterium]|nr:5-(carboxyamino)imidazole ribonucleotide mutase [Candidatus Woesebacteria bacterium]